jgi:hypothetical protein
MSDAAAHAPDEQRIKDLYVAICEAKNLDQAIEGLTSGDLRELGTYLIAQNPEEWSVQLEIVSRIVAEGWRRFAALTEGGNDL